MRLFPKFSPSSINLLVMRILDPASLKKSDELTIASEGISSSELMERAGIRFMDEFLNDASLLRALQYGNEEIRIGIVCGPGNNGGDGLVLARHLHIQGFSVEVFILKEKENPSADHLLNLERCKEKNVPIQFIHSEKDIPDWSGFQFLVDALFGYGLNRKTEGLAKNIIQSLNQSLVKIYSIDIPSGLFCEDNSQNPADGIIRAWKTFTFHCPKLSFLFPENSNYVGHWKVIDIGLKENSVLKKERIFSTHELIVNHLKLRSKFSHKGDYGHALLLAGSKGMFGAAALSSSAVLLSGAGLLTTHLPSHGAQMLHSYLPEAMVNADENEDFITEIPDLSRFDAIGVGPGIGRDKQTANALKVLIQQCNVPMVIDADALNLLAENKTWLAFLPQNTILSPHPGEFDRLFGKHSSSWDRYLTAKEEAIKKGIIIILKGAHTLVAFPNGDVFFNSTGNPSMAKGGSGDVLTGIILGLLSRGYEPATAAVMAVYIHGKSGDMALNERGPESVLARDILGFLPICFQDLYN